MFLQVKDDLVPTLIEENHYDQNIYSSKLLQRDMVGFVELFKLVLLTEFD